MSNKTSDVVLESRYNAIQPPELDSLASDSIINFLEKYERYVELFTKSEEKDRKIVGRLDCLTRKWKRVLEMKHPEVLKDEESFKSYLTDECSLTDAAAVKSAFDKISMNMRIPDVRSRLATYDADFLEVKERCDGIKLKDSALSKAYVAGIRPDSVKMALENELQLQEIKFAELLQKAEGMILADDETYHQRRAIERTGTGNVKTDTHKNKERPTVMQVPSHSANSQVPYQGAATPSQSTPSARPQRENAGICKICGGKWSKEHFAECLRKHREKQAKAQINAVESTVTVGDATNQPNQHTGSLVPPILVDVSVGGTVVKGYIDTGAAISCISTSLAEQLSRLIPVEFAPCARSLELANDDIVPTRKVVFTLSLPSNTIADKVTLRWSFSELSGKKPKLLIGRDLQRRLGYLLDDGTMKLPVDKERERQESLEDGLEDSVFRVDPITLNTNADKQSDCGEAQVSLVTVPASTYAEEVKKVLVEYSEVFSCIMPPDGADFPPFRVELEEDKVISLPVRTIHDESVKKEVARQFEEGLVDGRFKPYNGPWGNPVVIVVKPPKIRVCGDYRALNHITKTHHYPLHDIRTLLQAAVGCKVFAKLDLRNGFNQMRVYGPDQEKLAIRSLNYHVKCAMLPYGPKNGPMVFQEQMDAAFDDLLIARALVIFIDDMIVLGRDVPDFLENLRNVLKRCLDKRLRVKAPKCIAGATEIDAVGYVLSDKGRRMSEERISAVKKLTAPKNLHELWSVLGAFNYFREFIDHCAEVEEPLNRLMRKDVLFEWTVECETAFNQLKDALTTETVLAYGSEPGIVVVKSDASATGIGGVLVLRHPDGKDQPIGFYSKTFNGTQCRWTTIEQELFSIVYAVSQKCYDDILKSRKFLIETDHRNLVFLDKLSESNDKIMRWRMVLMQYTFDICHVPGESNVVADMLSRIGHDLPADEVMEVDVSPTLDSRIAVAQATHSKDKAWSSYSYDASTKLYYSKEGLIVIPDDAEGLMKELFKATHGSPMVGHVGIKNTVASIRKAGYTWSCMVKDVAKFLSSCPICQKTRDTLDPMVEMKTTCATEAMRSLAIDAIGPFPPDKHGNCYIQTMTDKFTRKTRLAVSKSADALSAAEAITDKWVLEYGVPFELQSDNGSQYVNQVISALVNILQMRHHRVVPYHPQANGIVERTNKEIVKHLKCLVLSFGDIDDWSEMVPLVEHIVNNTVHSALGVSPNTMLYGDGVLHCTKPFAYLKASPSTSVLRKFPELTIDAKTYVDSLTRRLNLIHESARKCQEAVVKKRLERNNPPDRIPVKYNPGAFVFVVPIKRTGKLETTLEGPYKVLECVHDSLYLLQSLVDPTITIKCHPERLRLFLSDDTPESDLVKLARFDKKEYVVDKILNHRGTNKKNIEFLVRWEGYSSEDDSYEPFKNVDGCDKLDDYLQSHPDAKAIVQRKAHKDTTTNY